MPGGLDRKNGAERWAGRSFLAVGYLGSMLCRRACLKR